MCSTALAIETRKLYKTYGPRKVVDGLSLHVPKGCVYGFIGPNGAGKSTTMKMLLGLVRPTSGMVQLLGQTLTQDNRIELLGHTGSLIESPSGYAHLTGQENLAILADLKGVPRKDIGRVPAADPLAGKSLPSPGEPGPARPPGCGRADGAAPLAGGSAGRSGAGAGRGGGRGGGAAYPHQDPGGDLPHPDPVQKLNTCI